MGVNSGRTFAFSVFVFNTQTGELLRNGRKLRIPDQTARFLAMLLENSGAMVTREDLRTQLWPDGEVLDYDHSINRVVSQLRGTLGGHSSKSTQYIETIPKRGYRFKASVRELRLVETDVPEQQQQEPAPELTAHSVEVVLPAATPQAAADPNKIGFSPTEKPLAAAPSRLPRLDLVSVSLSLLLAAGVWTALYVNHHRTPQPLSLGIVPFETNGENASALAESFRLDLADTLSQVPSVEVRAAHSFNNSGRDEFQARSRAIDLNVAVLLFGKFSVQESQCLLQLELVRSKDGVHLGSFQYSGTKDELASIRDHVERDIFVRLKPSGSLTGLAVASPSSPKAYEAYLRGRYYLSQWTDESLEKAITSFQEALRSEPGYARAYAGMGTAYFVLSQHGMTSRRQSIQKARENATKALSLDHSLAEAYAILGQVSLNEDWNFALAEEQLHRAVELDPYHAIYRLWLSVLYCEEGKFAPALQQIDKAHAADPNWAPVYMTEIFAAGSAGQVSRADHAAQMLIQMMPGWPLAHEQNALFLWNSKRYPEAIEEWKVAATLEKDVGRTHLEEQGALALRSGGVAAYARLRLHAIATHQGVSHEDTDFIPAEWHAYAGDWDAAMTGLEDMVKQHSQEALQVATNPAYSALHGTPRFESLMKSIGLPTVQH